MQALGTTIREISIKDACIQHFKDIEHDINLHNVTYENAQARERTQILMDIANQEGGIVIGTGDLSELALGWATYNGDQMSMYGVNASVPKTLMQHMVRHIAGMEADEKVKSTLLDIVDTPISPELTPADDNGNIKQKTEDLVGPYELHDFFIYHFIQYGFAPEKIHAMAKSAFCGAYDSETIKKWLTTFMRRFFSQQFKRAAMPDGPQVTCCSLSPQNGWVMTSDTCNNVWTANCEDIQ
jgi:NAD+ synthase (glutamine-hydrolysing)